MMNRQNHCGYIVVVYYIAVLLFKTHDGSIVIMWGSRNQIVIESLVDDHWYDEQFIPRHKHVSIFISDRVREAKSHHLFMWAIFFSSQQSILFPHLYLSFCLVIGVQSSFDRFNHGHIEIKIAFLDNSILGNDFISHTAIPIGM